MNVLGGDDGWATNTWMRRGPDDQRVRQRQELTSPSSFEKQQDKAERRRPSPEPVAARRPRPLPRRRLNQRTFYQAPINGFDATADEAARAETLVDEAQEQSHLRLTAWENPCPDGTRRGGACGDTGDSKGRRRHHHQNETDTDDQSPDLRHNILLLHPERGQSQAAPVHSTEQQHRPSKPAAARTTLSYTKKRCLDYSADEPVKQTQLIHKPRAWFTAHEALAPGKADPYDGRLAEIRHRIFCPPPSSELEPARQKKPPFEPEPLSTVGPRDDGSSCCCSTFVKGNGGQDVPLTPEVIGEEGHDTVGWLQPDDYAAYDRFKQLARELYPDLDLDTDAEAEHINGESSESESETDEERTILQLDPGHVKPQVKVCFAWVSLVRGKHLTDAG